MEQKMTDILTPEQRHRAMSNVKNRNTKPELKIRKGLHSYGLRYRMYDRSLPGKPDIVFPQYKVTIFIHGCFWHRHTCSRATMPATRVSFWTEKFTKNVERDKIIINTLFLLGWRVLIVWECTLIGKGKWPFCLLLDTIAGFILTSSTSYLELSNRNIIC